MITDCLCLIISIVLDTVSGSVLPHRRFFCVVITRKCARALPAAPGPAPSCITSVCLSRSALEAIRRPFFAGPLSEGTVPHLRRALERQPPALHFPPSLAHFKGCGGRPPLQRTKGAHIFRAPRVSFSSFNAFSMQFFATARPRPATQPSST